MKAGSSRFLFALAFALALAAGVAAGVMVARFASSFASVQAPSGTPATPTLDDLQLTDMQRNQIQKIWEGVKEKSDQSYQEANQLQRKFDDRVQGLLTPEQLKQYEQFHDEYQEQYFKLHSERDAAVKKAIEETKTLLSDDQRRKYDVILKSRLGPPSGTAPSTVAPRDIPSTASKKPSGGPEL